VTAADDDPGDVVILLNLADFVGEHLATSEERPTALERALGLIETLIDCSEDPDDTADLVGMAFFDSFSPLDRQRLTPWLGPRSLLPWKRSIRPGVGPSHAARAGRISGCEPRRAGAR